MLVDVAPPEMLSLYRGELGSVGGLAIVLLHAQGDVLVARDLDRGHPLGLEAAFWHGRIREWRDHLVAHAGSYDQSHDTGPFSAEQSAQKLAALLDR